ncbi:hypothetical protein [Rummeliibacillus pycnus]
MEQYMVPNSRENDIKGIVEVIIYGELLKEDKKILFALFNDYEEKEDSIIIYLGTQIIRFINSNTYNVEIILDCCNQEFSNSKLEFNNISILSRSYDVSNLSIHAKRNINEITK